jgi:predicted transcriptional regulator
MDRPKTIRPVLPAKPCFGHIGGQLGNLLMERFIEKGWIAKAKNDQRHYYITKKGEKLLQTWGSISR